MILAILQARTSSTRLAGKVLKKLLGKSMLLRQIERIKYSDKIDRLVVATSQDKSDDVLVKMCHEYQVDCIRGSLNNVLDRFYQAAKSYNPSHIIRLTGDCPLIDPAVIDSVIDYHLRNNLDYTSNINPPTFPDGLDVEVMTFNTLAIAWKEAKLPSEREHVTPFICQHPQLFKTGCFSYKEDLSFLRWTVDEPEDFLFVTKIYETLYPKNPNFSMNDILKLLQKYPSLKKINQKFERNEGYKRSLQEERGKDHE